MASTLTANAELEKIADGEEENTWGGVQRTTLDEIDKLTCGVLNVAVGGAIDVTLTRTQWLNSVLTFSGAISANINVIFPTIDKPWTVKNTTTGAFTVTAKTVSGTGSVITQGNWAIIHADATNVVEVAELGPTGVFTTLGVGLAYTEGTLHVRTADAGGGTAATTADDVVIENNAAVGVTLLSPNNVVARYNFGDPENNEAGFIQYDHSSDTMLFGVSAATRARISSGGIFFIAESANTKMTIGLTINQGTADDEILALKASDVTHTFTTQAEADTFGEMHKQAAAGGGLEIAGYSTSNVALQMQGHADATDIADTDTTADVGVILFDAFEDTGTSRQAVTAGNIFCIRNGSTARFLLKEDGELHLGSTTLVTLSDDKNDVELLRAFDHDKAARGAKGLIRSKWDEFVRYNKADLIEAGILGKDGEDGSEGLWNLTQHIQLLNGATWQLYTALQETQERLALTERKLAALPS